jgi:hypothetical protein
LRPWVRRALPAAGWLALASLLLFLFYGSVYLTVDAAMALAWGDEILRGGTPDFTAPLHPVFHPLAAAVGAALSPLGTDPAIELYGILSVAAMAGLAYGGYRLGRELGGGLAGLLAAALLLTRPELMTTAWLATVDVPFVGLTLFALALLLAKPWGNRWVALSILALAGLLRPEGWLIPIVYAAWLATRTRGRERTALVALGLAGPILWLLADLILTGDPTTSLVEARNYITGDLAELGYKVARTFQASPLYILDSVLPYILSWPLLIGGIAAALHAVVVMLAKARDGWAPADTSFRGVEPDLGWDERAGVVAGGTLLVIGTIVFLDFADFPVAIRFLILPASLLAVLFAAALARMSGPGPWRAVVVGCAIGVAVVLPSDLDLISFSREARADSAEFIGDVRDLAGRAEVRAAVEECGGGFAAGGERTVIIGVAVLAMELDLDASEVPIWPKPGAEFPTVLLLNGGPNVGSAAGGRLRARELIADEGPWELWSRCGSPGDS